MKLLLLHDIDVNTAFKFTPNYSIRPTSMRYALDEMFHNKTRGATTKTKSTRTYALQGFDITPLIIAIGQSASNKNMEKIALMCIEQEAKWTFSSSDPIQAGNQTTITALHLAAYVDNAQIISALLARGADINAQANIFDDGGGQNKIRQRATLHTPTAIAIWRNATNAVTTLQARGGMGGATIRKEDEGVLKAVYGGLCTREAMNMI